MFNSQHFETFGKTALFFNFEGRNVLKKLTELAQTGLK